MSKSRVFQTRNCDDDDMPPWRWPISRKLSKKPTLKNNIPFTNWIEFTRFYLFYGCYRHRFGSGDKRRRRDGFHLHRTMENEEYCHCNQSQTNWNTLRIHVENVRTVERLCFFCNLHHRLALFICNFVSCCPATTRPKIIFLLDYSKVINN